VRAPKFVVGFVAYTYASAVGTKVKLPPGLSVLVRVGVCVEVAVIVGVAVPVNVAVGVFVLVDVPVCVAVGVRVMVGPCGGTVTVSIKSVDAAISSKATS
jgi:hypothetical protein